MLKEGKRIYLRKVKFDDLAQFAEWEKLPSVNEFFTINEGRDYEEVVTEYMGRKDDEDKMEIAICLKDEAKQSASGDNSADLGLESKVGMADSGKLIHDAEVGMADSGKLIGRVYISNIDRHYDSLDMTRIYIGDTSFRGQGYGEEALKLVMDFAFQDMKVERLTLDYFDGNEIASKLYNKVGFHLEGCMRNAGKKNGKYVNLNLMSILKEEYIELY